MKYAFLIGRNPRLSIAELLAVLNKDKDLKNMFSDESGETVIFDCGLPENPQKFLDRLGGVIKIFEITGENIPVSEIKNFCFQRLYKKFIQRNGGKSLFAVSLFPSHQNQLKSKQSRFNLGVHEILMKLKRELKTAKINCRFINKNFQNVSHVAVFEENLIENGLDIGIFRQDNNAMIGKTIAIQDFKAYAKRDYGKPFRDPKAGMMPPKLAQIMINLAAQNLSGLSPASAIIYDPFCGTGSILMEAMLMGYSVIGSDLSAKMIEGAKKNLKWLRENFEIEENVESFLFQKDALSITKKSISPFIMRLSRADEAISNFIFVTESYLGEPLEKNISENEFAKIKPEFLNFYEKFFRNLTKEFGMPRVCIAIPMFRFKNSFLRLEEFEKIAEKYGFKIEGRYQYSRQDQYVGREIFVLK